MLLVLLHDFPEFLCDYHFSFCDVIPPNCIQMRNLILSAFPRNMRLPDPFTPNLKVRFLSCSGLHFLDTRHLSSVFFFTQSILFHKVSCVFYCFACQGRVVNRCKKKACCEQNIDMIFHVFTGKTFSLKLYIYR